jgi:glutamine synthetase
MTPSEAKQFLCDNKVRYILAQFVDIHGWPRPSRYPVEHYGTVVTAGAGFAGFAIWGMGMSPTSMPTYMAVGDASTLSLVPWQPGYARIACDGTRTACRTNTTARVVLKKQLEQAHRRAAGTFYTGMEPEFSLLRKVEGKILPADAGDTLAKPCYDYKGLSRARVFLERLSKSLRVRSASTSIRSTTRTRTASSRSITPSPMR